MGRRHAPSIRTKLLIFTLGTGAAVTMLVGGLSYAIGVRALEGQIETSLSNLAQARANEMDTYLTSAAKIASVLADSIEVDTTRDETMFTERMRTVLISNPDIYGAAVGFEPYAFDPERKYFSPYWWYNDGVPSFIHFGSDDYVYWERDWYIAARDSGQQRWSKPFFDEGAGEISMVTSSVPIYYGDEFVGVTNVDVSLERLSEILMEVASSDEFTGRGHALLIDDAGQIVSIGDPESFGIEPSRVFETTVASLGTGSIAAATDWVQGRERSVYRVSSPHESNEGELHFAAHAPISSTGWHLVVTAPADALLADAVTLRNASIAVVVLVIALSAAITVWIARRLTRPITDLTETVKQVSQGNLAVRAKVSSNDESGVLATAFNDMTARLRSVVSDLRAEIEERKQIEQDLMRLNQAIEQSPMSVTITNTEGAIEYVNPKFIHTSGFSTDEVIGELPRVLRDDIGAGDVIRDVWATITIGDEWRGELRNVRKTGEEFWELVSVAGVRGVDGTITNFVIVAEDITRRKQMEEEHVRQERLAAVGQLAAGIAHDFNNLLMAIMANAELTRRRADLPDDVVTRLAQIVSHAQRGAGLTRQVLDFTRQTSGDPQLLDLRAYLEESLSFMRRVVSEQVRLRLQADDGGYEITANPAQIQQVIANLTVNARDAMPNGGEIRFELDRVHLEPDDPKRHPDATTSDWVRLVVRDNGSGIPAEVLPRVFEPFFTTKAVGQGSGLGLAQVFGIIDSHGGWIGVESVEGEGTTFTVYLPAAIAEHTAPSGIDDVIPHGQGETILLVEDDPQLREVVSSMLEVLDYRVLVASDGAEALAVIATNGDHVDLVLTDAVMPEMDGFSLAAALADDAPSINVVMMSGYSGSAGDPSTPRPNIVCLLDKPVSLPQLGTALSGAIKV